LGVAILSYPRAYERIGLGKHLDPGGYQGTGTTFGCLLQWAYEAQLLPLDRRVLAVLCLYVGLHTFCIGGFTQENIPFLISILHDLNGFQTFG
jgi:hypothetical protein